MDLDISIRLVMLMENDIYLKISALNIDLIECCMFVLMIVLYYYCIYFYYYY